MDPRFTDDKAGGVVISDGICAMLLTEEFCTQFTGKDLVDTTTATEAIMALTVESRQRVDELTDRALAAGGQVGYWTRTLCRRSSAEPGGHRLGPDGEPPAGVVSGMRTIGGREYRIVRRTPVRVGQ